MALPKRVRRPLGAAMLLVFIPLYALIVVQIAVVHIPEGDTLANTVYFAITGLAWIFPAGLIIRWMLKPVGGAA